MSRVRIAAVGDVTLLHRPGDGIQRSGWDNADLRIANLEAPLTEGGVPAAKLIRLKSPRESAVWLRDDLGCQLVSLANNHIMDWGAPGLEATLEALDQAGIAYAGAGMNGHAAGRHHLVEVADRRIAFLSWACTVPPGFRATAEQPGLAALRVRTSYAADPFLIDEQPGTPPWVHTEAIEADIAAFEQAVIQARAVADLVILAVHWGVPPQWQSAFQGPLAEYQETLAPRLVAAGADLVLGHHAHTVYGVEAFAGALVCYSLGNYIFHPLASRRTTIPLDAPTRPYHAPERPENRDSFVAAFHIDGPPGGRAHVAEARFTPALLDEAWEARPALASESARILDRLTAFSTWRTTPTSIDDGALVWRPRP